MRRGVKIFFDGGCRGASREMEIAVVAAGRTTILRDLGPGTSGTAEWLALIHALRIARALDLLDVVLVGDSADVVAKARGTVGVRGADIGHLARYRELAASGPAPRVRRVRRAQNLAGIALSRLHPR